jgi:hypothetical protein
MGEQIAGSEKQTEFGVTVDREGRVGGWWELATLNQFQFYFENAIERVIDILSGKEKYREYRWKTSSLNRFEDRTWEYWVKFPEIPRSEPELSLPFDWTSKHLTWSLVLRDR